MFYRPIAQVYTKMAARWINSSRFPALVPFSQARLKVKVGLPSARASTYRSRLGPHPQARHGTLVGWPPSRFGRIGIATKSC